MPRAPKTHLDIKFSKGKHYGYLRSSFRKDGKVCHDTHYTFHNSSESQLLSLRAALNGGMVVTESDIEISDSREYGASAALFELAGNIGLIGDIYSRLADWVRDVLAMIIGRIVFQGSKLSLANITDVSALWEVCGFDTREIDVDKHCYESMDKLFKRQKEIEKNLARRYLRDNVVILYDITSSYFEGEYNGSDLVTFGYNRDKKKGHKQIVIGLICTKTGCPISVQVFAGNTDDFSTVEGKITEIKRDFGISEAIFVGDRGMLKTSNFDSFDSIKTVSGLTHADIKTLLEHDSVQLSMFDENTGTEIVLPETPGVRYMLMKNPLRAAKEDEDLDRLLEKTEAEFAVIANYKRKTGDDKLNQRLGSAKGKFKVGKYFDCGAENGKVTWSRKADKIAEDVKLHGLYVIRTNTVEDLLDAGEIVSTYRSLVWVEQAFRTMKTTELEMRPIYHKKEDRIRAHVFICMLAYHLLWHMKQRLSPLFVEDGNGKDREVTLESIVRKLACIRTEKVVICGNTTFRVTKPTDKQQLILDLLRSNTSA